MSLFNYLRSKFDWVVYCLFWRSINRSLVKSPGVIYGMSLEFERLLKDLPISEDDKRKIKDVYNKHHGITEGKQCSKS